MFTDYALETLCCLLNYEYMAMFIRPCNPTRHKSAMSISNVKKNGTIDFAYGQSS